MRGVIVRKPSTAFRALRLLREPIPAEKRWLMRARRETLDPRWRTVGQGLGQQSTGCGATIGVHPRCDFACTGCYLGADANQSRPLTTEQVLRQLDRIRAWLGPKGNVQITDGEVTLLSVEDLVAILRYARGLGLIPMVMTHGDTFRREADLLERLMVDGGLTEVSIHVDTTQRGRLGYKNATSELDLHALRDEFAGMIRTARKNTGLPLRAATTATITRENLRDVSSIVKWCIGNRDAFSLLSLQPVAQVGRTQPGLAGITVAELWKEIERALSAFLTARPQTHALMFGHPDCTRIELFAVYERAQRSPRLVPIMRDGHIEDTEMVRAFFERNLGGLNFRDDPVFERVCRAAGVLLSEPRWVLGPLRRWALGRVAEVGTSATQLVLDVVRRRAKIGSFCVASHHFMSAAELATPTGQERLAACVFRVPIGDEMVPMCRVNTSGAREAVYGRSASPSTPRGLS